MRLFVTLIRFDAVYVLHFKTNLRVRCLAVRRNRPCGACAHAAPASYRLLSCARQRIADYPNLQNYVKEIYQMPGIRETVDFVHIKHHYMVSHRQINPLGIVAKGPLLDFDSPHARARLKGQPIV